MGSRAAEALLAARTSPDQGFDLKFGTEPPEETTTTTQQFTATLKNELEIKETGEKVHAFLETYANRVSFTVGCIQSTTLGSQVKTRERLGGGGHSRGRVGH